MCNKAKTTITKDYYSAKMYIENCGEVTKKYCLTKVWTIKR